jgi:hypothetical protein
MRFMSTSMRVEADLRRCRSYRLGIYDRMNHPTSYSLVRTTGSDSPWCLEFAIPTRAFCDPDDQKPATFLAREETRTRFVRDDHAVLTRRRCTQGLSKRGIGVSSKSAIVREPASLSAVSVHPTLERDRTWANFESTVKRADSPFERENMSPLVTLGRIPLQSKLKPRIPIQKLRLSVL